VDERVHTDHRVCPHRHADRRAHVHRLTA